MSSNKAPASVLPSDIQVYAINDAMPLNKNGPRGFIERFLHSEIYKVRSFVLATTAQR